MHFDAFPSAANTPKRHSGFITPPQGTSTLSGVPPMEGQDRTNLQPSLGTGQERVTLYAERHPFRFDAACNNRIENRINTSTASSPGGYGKRYFVKGGLTIKNRLDYDLALSWRSVVIYQPAPKDIAVLIRLLVFQPLRRALMI